jgi:uncharacterized membrane protein YccC
MEPAMTPLGLGAEHCREALERYREGVAALAGLLATPQRVGPGNATLAALDDLVNRLAVDSLSRRGSKGSHRMTQIEAELFEPVVTATHHELETLARRPPSNEWLPTLHAVDRQLEAAEHDIERWHRQVGVD